MKTAIIGGGIQTVTIAMKLIENKKLTYNDLSIFDPNPLCYRWMNITNKIGMQHLRSTIVHHVHPDPFHLKRFAKESDYASPFFGYYQRPKLEMFNDHIQSLIKHYHLDECHIKESVTHINKINQQFIINDTYTFDKVIIATGMNHIHHIPECFKSLDQNLFVHAFSDETELDNDIDVIVGGGITACHIANTISNHRHVTLIMRHEIRTHELDTDPGWLGPKYLSHFYKAPVKERRQMIQNARYRGSIPQFLKQMIKSKINDGKITLIKDQIDYIDNHYIYLTDTKIDYKKIVLATGCEKNIQKNPLIKQMIQTLNLPTAECGYPILNEKLEWMPNLIVTGPFAELYVGPMSRNIMGGRQASEIISKYFNS